MIATGAAPPEEGAGALRRVPIRVRGDVLPVGTLALRLAREAGLGSRRAQELAIVVCELASNIVKYGVRGEVALGLAAGAEGVEFVVVARDVGPPIHDLATALGDGCDDRGPIDPAAFLRRGGLGTGLGAVARLADRFEVRHEETGKAITAGFRRERSRPGRSPK